MPNDASRGIRATQIGIVINAGLAAIKFAAGILGHTYALVADAAESTADIFSSLIVWGGLAVAAQPADEDHPYGHGKAESIAGAVVAMFLLGAAVGIAVQAIREIRTPHQVPAPWTLIVLVGVFVVKWILARRVHAVGSDIGSGAVKADASHHMSDAITSAAAFIGISIAVVGSRYRGGSGWESADDWAALVASLVIAFNGIRMLRPALGDLMDEVPDAKIVNDIRRAAETAAGVLGTEKLGVRRAGMALHVTIHVQADGRISLDEGHRIGGAVKAAIRAAAPSVADVLVHMEPYVEPSSAATIPDTRYWTSQQRSVQNGEGDAEINDESGHVDECRDERR